MKFSSRSGRHYYESLCVRHHQERRKCGGWSTSNRILITMCLSICCWLIPFCNFHRFWSRGTRKRRGNLTHTHARQQIFAMIALFSVRLRWWRRRLLMLLVYLTVGDVMGVPAAAAEEQQYHQQHRRSRTTTTNTTAAPTSTTTRSTNDHNTSSPSSSSYQYPISHHNITTNKIQPASGTRTASQSTPQLTSPSTTLTTTILDGRKMTTILQQVFLIMVGTIVAIPISVLGFVVCLGVRMDAAHWAAHFHQTTHL